MNSDMVSSIHDFLVTVINIVERVEFMTDTGRGCLHISDY